MAASKNNFFKREGARDEPGKKRSPDRDEPSHMEEKVSMETTLKTANRGSLKSRGKRPLMDVIRQKNTTGGRQD